MIILHRASDSTPPGDRSLAAELKSTTFLKSESADAEAPIPELHDYPPELRFRPSGTLAVR
jgi:hypothetical protein